MIATGVTGAYETKVSGLSAPNIVQNGGFTLSNLASTGPSGGICGSNCVATISGFVAGSNGSRRGGSLRYQHHRRPHPRGGGAEPDRTGERCQLGAIDQFQQSGLQFRHAQRYARIGQRCQQLPVCRP